MSTTSASCCCEKQQEQPLIRTAVYVKGGGTDYESSIPTPDPWNMTASRYTGVNFNTLNLYLAEPEKCKVCSLSPHGTIEVLVFQSDPRLAEAWLPTRSPPISFIDDSGQKKEDPRIEWGWFPKVVPMRIAYNTPDAAVSEDGAPYLQFFHEFPTLGLDVHPGDPCASTPYYTPEGCCIGETNPDGTRVVACYQSDLYGKRQPNGLGPYGFFGAEPRVGPPDIDNPIDLDGNPKKTIPVSPITQNETWLGFMTRLKQYPLVVDREGTPFPICDCFNGEKLSTSPLKTDLENERATKLMELCTKYRVGANAAHIVWKDSKFLGIHDTTIITDGDDEGNNKLIVRPGQHTLERCINTNGLNGCCDVPRHGGYQTTLVLPNSFSGFNLYKPIMYDFKYISENPVWGDESFLPPVDWDPTKKVDQPIPPKHQHNYLGLQVRDGLRLFYGVMRETLGGFSDFPFSGVFAPNGVTILPGLFDSPALWQAPYVLNSYAWFEPSLIMNPTYSEANPGGGSCYVTLRETKYSGFATSSSSCPVPRSGCFPSGVRSCEGQGSITRTLGEIERRELPRENYTTAAYVNLVYSSTTDRELAKLSNRSLLYFTMNNDVDNTGKPVCPFDNGNDSSFVITPCGPDGPCCEVGDALVVTPRLAKPNCPSFKMKYEIGEAEYVLKKYITRLPGGGITYNHTVDFIRTDLEGHYQLPRKTFQVKAKTYQPPSGNCGKFIGFSEYPTDGKYFPDAINDYHVTDLAKMFMRGNPTPSSSYNVKPIFAYWMGTQEEGQEITTTENCGSCSNPDDPDCPGKRSIMCMITVTIVSNCPDDGTTEIRTSESIAEPCATGTCAGDCSCYPPEQTTTTSKGSDCWNGTTTYTEIATPIRECDLLARHCNRPPPAGCDDPVCRCDADCRKQCLGCCAPTEEEEEEPCLPGTKFISCKPIIPNAPLQTRNNPWVAWSGSASVNYDQVLNTYAGTHNIHKYTPPRRGERVPRNPNIPNWGDIVESVSPDVVKQTYLSGLFGPNLEYGELDLPTQNSSQSYSPIRNAMQIKPREGFSKSTFSTLANRWPQALKMSGIKRGRPAIVEYDIIRNPEDRKEYYLNILSNRTEKYPIQTPNGYDIRSYWEQRIIYELADAFTKYYNPNHGIAGIPGTTRYYPNGLPDLSKTSIKLFVKGNGVVNTIGVEEYDLNWFNVPFTHVIKFYIDNPV